MFKNLLRLPVISLPEISRLVEYTSRRHAGHSKWQNIRHIKGLKDGQKSILFQKIGKQMKMAVQEGGSADVNSNLKLAHAVEQAKRANMPSSSIQSILKSAQADKSNCKGHTIEIKGPGNCIILCEVYTDNLHHFRQQLQSVLKRHASKYADAGCMHMFEQKGIIEAETDKQMPSKDALLEAATDVAIEAGAEDVQVFEDNLLQFTCGASCLKSVTDELEKRNYKVTSANVEYIPIKLQQLSEQELELCEKLYDKLELMQEVVRLSNNIG